MFSTVFSTTEAAKEARVTVTTIRRWIQLGYLRATRIAGRYFVDREDFDQLMKDIAETRPALDG